MKSNEALRVKNKKGHVKKKFKKSLAEFCVILDLQVLIAEKLIQAVSAKLQRDETTGYNWL